MKKIRSILVTICFLIFGIGSILFNFLLFPFIKNYAQKLSKNLGDFSQT